MHVDNSLRPNLFVVVANIYTQQGLRPRIYSNPKSTKSWEIKAEIKRIEGGNICIIHVEENLLKCTKLFLIQQNGYSQKSNYCVTQSYRY